MHTLASIRPVKQIFRGRVIDLPEEPGVYAFWWIGKKAQLLSANRHIILKGPGERPVNVEYKDWWPPELAYPCLYVGKSTNIKKRFSLHIGNSGEFRGNSGDSIQQLTDDMRQRQNLQPWQGSPEWSFRISRIMWCSGEYAGWMYFSLMGTA